MSRFSLIALSPNLSFLPTTSKETPASHITNKARFPCDPHDRCNRHHRPKIWFDNCDDPDDPWIPHDHRDCCDRRSFVVKCIKTDDGYSVFTSVVTDSISPNSESIRSPFKTACYLFVLNKNWKPLKFVNSLCPGTTSFEVSSTPYPVIIILYFDAASYGNIANFSLSFVQQLIFLYSSFAVPTISIS